LLPLFNRAAAEPKGDEWQPPGNWLLQAGQYGSMLLGFSAIVLVWAGAIYFSYSEWAQTERAARHTAENLALALEEQVNRTIRAADQTLLYLRDSYAKDPQHFDISLWTHDTQFLTGAMVQVAIIDKSGKLVADNISGAPLGIDLSDRYHFKVHAKQQSDELYISKPILGRISHKVTIQLTRRVVMPDGSFGGVVVVSLDPEYFSHVYQTINIGKESTVALIGSDGIIRARRAAGPSLVGSSLTAGEVFEQLKRSSAGFFMAKSVTDGVDRIFAYRKLKDFPLIITVGLARDEVFRASEQNQQRHFAIAGLLTMWLFGATYLMGRYQEMLAQARDAAEEGTRARSEFLAMMSHEIRTPMNGVIGMADLLLDSGLSGQQLDYAKTMRESATHLLKIINDVLDFSKLEAGRVETEKIPFKLHDLVHTTIALLDAEAKEKRLTLTVNIASDVPVAVLGDPGRLRQLLLNFVGNGLKFTKFGSVTVTVTTDPARAADKVRVLFAIADTGIGIPQDAIPLLFRKFSQLDSSIARRFGGTGLGLAISKRFIDILGGTIEVESKVGSGTTFRFAIDYAPASIDALPRAQAPLLAPPSSGCREALKILLVEDNKTNQIVATKLIEGLGHCVDVAANGPEALTACAHIEYDAIFMDVMMPGMDGLAATRAIRKLKPPFCNARVIALTANVQTRDIEECRAAGMNDYLAKPVTRAQIAEKLGVIAETEAPIPLAPAEPALGGPAVFDDAIYGELADALGADGIRAVLEQFLADSTERVAAMRQAASGGDAACIKLEAHTAKSSSANLGFLRLSAVAETLEHDAPVLGAADLASRVEEIARLVAEIQTIAMTLLSAETPIPVSGSQPDLFAASA
jgi:two-component system, sensor histidine kinase